MRRLLRASILVMALAVAVPAFAVGCSYADPPAVTISADSASDPYFTMTRDEMFKQLDAARAKTTAGTAKTGYTTAAIAAFLTKTVNDQISKQQAPAKEEAKKKLMAAHNASVTDADRKFAQQVASQNSQAGSTPSQSEIEIEAELIALARAMGAEEVAAGRFDKNDAMQKLYDANKDKLAQPAQSCWHVIVIAPPQDPNATGPTPPTATEQAAAVAAKARLATEDFGTVADSVSSIKDSAPGGDLGCRDESQLPKDAVAAVAGLAVGAVSDPIELADSYAIIRVDERKPASTPTFDDVKTQLEQAVLQQAGQKVAAPEIKRIADELANRTVVKVDPRFGSWDSATKTVNPPDGAADPTEPTTTTTAFDPTQFGQGIPGIDSSGDSAPRTSTPSGTTPPGSTPPGTGTASASSTTTTANANGDASASTSTTGSSTTTTPVASSTTSTTGGSPSR